MSSRAITASHLSGDRVRREARMLLPVVKAQRQSGSQCVLYSISRLEVFFFPCFLSIYTA